MKTNKELIGYINTMQTEDSIKKAMIKRIEGGDNNLKVVLSAMIRRK